MNTGGKGIAGGVYGLNNLGLADPIYLDSGLDSLKIADGSVSNSQFQLIPYLDGTTSNIQSQINALIAGTSFRGGYDASTNLFPTTGGTGGGGAVQIGNSWAITTYGILGGIAVIVGTTITALVNTPGQTAGNWSVPQDQIISVFGRLGIVTSQIGDYAFSQISGTATIAQGGSGQTTANDALNAFLPTQVGNANKILQTDATNSGWVNASSLGEVYNSGGNTPNSLVIRDGFGELYANIADSANSANIIGTGPDTTDTVAYPLFVNNVGPSFQSAKTNTNFNYNAVTNALTINSLNLGANTNQLIFGTTNTMTHTMAALTGSRIFTLPDANSNSVIPSAAVATQFLTEITSGGVTTRVQPAFTDISGIATIAQGGSGQITANAAFNAFAPSQTGQSGKVLSTNGTNTSWIAASTGSVTTVSVTTANGFAGTVANSTTTPAISVQTSVTGILKGNGTSVSAAVATDIPTTNVLSSATNTMTSNVNSVSSNAPIVNSNALGLVTTSLTSTVNGVAATAVQVSPGAQSVTSSITFTNLDEKILLIAPLVNAIGTYQLQLIGTGQELNIVFSISGNSNTSYNYSTIDIITVTDTTGNITKSNLSNFILFRGFVRNTAPNSYFAVTFSMSAQLIYTNPLSMTVWQYGASYLNNNTTLTNLITGDIANLVSLAAADLSFKMKINTVTTTISNPQGYVYSTSGASAAIFQYSINTLTGALSALSPSTISSTAYKVAITPLRNYLYAVAGSGTILLQYRINPTNGTLSALSPASVATTNTATGVAIDPTGRFLYACGFGTGLFSQYTITPSNGQLVAIAGAPTAAAQMQDVVVHPSGKWLYAINNGNGLVYQYSINQTTGALVALGTPTIAAGSGPIKIVIHPSGLYAYVANNGAGTISQFSINQTTGQLTAIGSPFSAGAGIWGLTISNNGLFIYYGCSTANILGQSTITPATGLITTPTTTVAANGARDCCFDYSGNFIYVYAATTTNVAGYSINQTTGAMTSIGTVAAGINSVGIAAA